MAPPRTPDGDFPKGDPRAIDEQAAKSIADVARAEIQKDPSIAGLTEPLRALTSATASAVGQPSQAGSWVWVREGHSFPGNSPNMTEIKARGCIGVVLKADDPYLVTMAQNARAAGLLVAVWDDTRGLPPLQYAAYMANAAKLVNADKVVANIEFVGKGYAGSPGWQYNTDAAAYFAQFLPGIPLAVCPLPNQDDFNYGAWVNIGAQVWPQTYGATLDQVFDPVEVYNRVVANGVPPELVFPVLPAGSLASGIPKLNELGLLGWSIYTIDDVGGADKAVPFGNPNPGAPAPSSGPSETYVLSVTESVALSDAPLSELVPVVLDDADDVDLDFEAGDELTIQEWDELDALWQSDDADGSLRFLAASSGGPHLIGYPGTGTHSWTAPPNNWQSDNAVDVAMRPGTAVLAVMDGVVDTQLGYGVMDASPSSRFGGSRLHIRHSNGMISFSHHLSRIRVARGARVRQGQRIGDSGIANGVAHLHFAVTQPFDPRSFWRRTFDANAPRSGPPAGTPDKKPKPVKPTPPQTLAQSFRRMTESRVLAPHHASRAIVAARAVLKNQVK